MNIIESRQKVLSQRLEFHADFVAAFPIDDNVVDVHDCDEHEDDHNKSYEDNWLTHKERDCLSNSTRILSSF